MTWLSTPAHARWLEAEGDRLLTFARASRHPDGGFAWLGDDGEPDLDRPVELWVTCRMTHVFALGDLMGRPEHAALADHGIAALQGRLRDHQHGGWYAQVGADGPTKTDKTAYEHAFVVLAGASAAAAGRPGGDELLADALEIMLGRFWDDEHGMVVEQWDESFDTLDGYRGVNANMHSVEALLAAADVLGDTSLRDRAQRIVTRVVHELAAGNSWRIPEHFDAEWTPQLEYNADEPAHPFRPYGATIGHWLEWSRLTLHLRASLGEGAPEWMLADARSLFAAAVAEGWAVDGADGLRLHRGLAGPPRRTGAHALGGRGGYGGRGRAAHGDRRDVVRTVVRDVVAPHQRRVRRRPRLVAARAVAGQRAQRGHLAGPAGRLPRPRRDPRAPPAAVPLCRRRSPRRPPPLTPRWSSAPLVEVRASRPPETARDRSRPSPHPRPNGNDPAPLRGTGSWWRRTRGGRVTRGARGPVAQAAGRTAGP